MFYEIRRYQANPGMRDEWVRYFEGTVAPFQRKHGAVIPGMFTDENNPDIFIWLRVFRDDAHREQVNHDMHEDPEWFGTIAPPIKTILVQGTVVVDKVIPTVTAEPQ